MSGQKKVSPPESSSTETPRELESPQPVESWADEIAHLIDGVKETRPEALPEAEPIPEPPQLTTPPRPEPAPTSISTISPQDITVPMMKVIEDGREVVRPDVIQAVVQLGTLGQLARIRRSLEREHFRGELDNRDLEATDEYQHINLIDDWPNTPWATAYFFNDGPNGVYIAINKNRPFRHLASKENLELDFTKSDKRIEFIEYYCDSGETATVNALGKY